MASPEDQREALARFADAVGAQSEAVTEALAYIGGKLLAVQEDHARAREDVYALTQRVDELERAAGGRPADRGY